MNSSNYGRFGLSISPNITQSIWAWFDHDRHDLPSGNQTWLAGKWTIHRWNPLETSISRWFPFCRRYLTLLNPPNDCKFYPKSTSFHKVLQDPQCIKHGPSVGSGDPRTPAAARARRPSGTWSSAAARSGGSGRRIMATWPPGNATGDAGRVGPLGCFRWVGKLDGQYELRKIGEDIEHGPHFWAIWVGKSDRLIDYIGIGGGHFPAHTMMDSAVFWPPNLQKFWTSTWLRCLKRHHCSPAARWSWFIQITKLLNIPGDWDVH